MELMNFRDAYWAYFYELEMVRILVMVGECHEARIRLENIMSIII